MEHVESVRLIAKTIAIVSMVGPALAQAVMFRSAFEAMGRNPEAADSLFTKMLVAAAMSESIAIYAFVAFFIL